MPSGRSVYELLQDYLRALAQAGALGKHFSKEQRELLAAYERFVSSQGHKLARRPQTLLPLAVAQPLDSPVHHSAIERCAN